MKKCLMCGDIARDKKYSGIAQYISEEYLNKKFIYEDNEFYIIPAIGCLNKGYLIISTKQHIINYASLNTKKIANFRIILDRIIHFTNIYQDGYIIFEHGNGVLQKGGNTVKHAHMHLLPLHESLFKQIVRLLGDKYNSLIIDDLSDILMVYNGLPYVFLYNGTEYHYFITPDIESQYIRRIIASKCGLAEQWDWKRYSHIDNFNKTYEALKGIDVKNV